MRNILNNHRPTTVRSEKPIVRVTDIELFDSPEILSCRDVFPRPEHIRELFDRRMACAFGAGDAMRVASFSVLSRSHLKENRYCVSWVAEVVFGNDYRSGENGIMFLKDHSYYLYGSFGFWRVGGAWRARVK